MKNLEKFISLGKDQGFEPIQSQKNFGRPRDSNLSKVKKTLDNLGIRTYPNSKIIGRPKIRTVSKIK